jgi:hypothetical protein
MEEQTYWFLGILATIVLVIAFTPFLRNAIGEFFTKVNPIPLLIAIMICQHFGGCSGEAQGAEPAPDMDKFLQCLHMKEASGKLKPIDGDGGKAIGPYQIHWKYWKDAVDHDSSIGGTYQDCRKKEYAEKIVRAYLDRWATKKRLGHSVTYEDLARVHNGGGPRCWHKHSKHWLWEKATTGYWKHASFDPVR